MVLFTLQEIFSFMKKVKKVEMNWPSDWFEGQMKNRMTAVQRFSLNCQSLCGNFVGICLSYLTLSLPEVIDK